MQNIACPVVKQIHVLPLMEEDFKVEYHLKTKSGTIMATFEDQELAEAYRDQQINKWGNKAPIGIIYRVTTITEKL